MRRNVKFDDEILELVTDVTLSDSEKWKIVGLIRPRRLEDLGCRRRKRNLGKDAMVGPMKSPGKKNLRYFKLSLRGTWLFQKKM